MKDKYSPLQHNEHVRAFDRHVVEEDARTTRRLRGEEGPPFNFHPEALAAVMNALRKTG